jgi:hypothetical protein
VVEELETSRPVEGFAIGIVRVEGLKGGRVEGLEG